MKSKEVFHYSILCLLVSLFLTLPVTAMTTDTEDVIYFKNGAILRGEIIERNGDESLKIETNCRNVVVVRLEEVEEIRRENIPVARYYKTSGYVNQTGLDLLPGNEVTSVRFQMVNGYQFTPRFSAGLGVGYTTYNDPLSLVPVFLDLRFKLFKANTTSYIFFKGGYNFTAHTDDAVLIEGKRGGYTINPGVGLHFDTSGDHGWYINVGYNIDKFGFDQQGWGGQTVINDHTFKRVNFGLGLSF